MCVRVIHRWSISNVWTFSFHDIWIHDIYLLTVPLEESYCVIQVVLQTFSMTCCCASSSTFCCKSV
jgi:hypothetical protein